MESIKTKSLYNLNFTIAAELLESCEYPFEILPKISNFILVKETFA